MTIDPFNLPDYHDTKEKCLQHGDCFFCELDNIKNQCYLYNDIISSLIQRVGTLEAKVLALETEKAAKV